MNSKKKTIPKALKEQVWIKQFGNNTFRAKCPIDWCRNEITPFNYECGHNIPESKKGATSIANLLPICSRCNKSMSNNYSIEEWHNVDKNKSEKPKKRQSRCCWFF